MKLSVEDLQTLRQGVLSSLSKVPIFDTNGIERNQYLNSHMLLSEAEVLKLCADILSTPVKHMEVDGLVGLALGGCSLAGVMCALTASSKKPLFSAMYRDRAKSYGYQGMLSRPIEPGLRICVVDDVISTGTSAKNAIEYLRDKKIDVPGVVSVVRRGNEGVTALKEAGVSVETLIDIYDVIEKK